MNKSDFSYGKIFVLGLGFGVISLTWSIYNAYVPLILESMMEGVSYLNTKVGMIMTLDNIAAISLIPLIGALSDRTWTRIGRRMPFLLFGMPITAFFFAVIPYIDFSLWVLILVIVIMNISMAAFRAPTIALMPDLTPSPLRSKANGIVNFMGGLDATMIGVPWPAAAILLATGGLFWALVNINSFPMVADMAPAARVAILAPPVFGLAMDITSRQAMFPMAAVSFVLSFLMLMGVRRGEAVKG